MRSTTGMAKKRLMALAAVLLFVTAAAVVSFQTIDGIPNWKRIYQFFGVADVSGKRTLMIYPSILSMWGRPTEFISAVMASIF